VVIETGTKKVFASAIDWPGWSRSGRTEDDALATLAHYADRYRVVADLAHTRGVVAAAGDLQVVEHVQGGGATDFGIPDRPAEIEREPMSESECDRQTRLLAACWETFDRVAASVSAELRKGPRGGGRDRDAIISHVRESERSYARALGLRVAADALGDPNGLAAHRDAVRAAMAGLNRSGEVPGAWPVRYVIRRMSWHLLDHAWEMEDKDLSDG
jgi:hypothetical protein